MNKEESMKIIFICQWDGNKEKTWSGTTYSLLKALRKYNDVIEIDMSLNKAEIFILRAFSVRFSKSGIKCNFDFSPLTIKYKNMKLKRKLKAYGNMPKLCIGDFGIIKDTFYYADLTIDTLLNLRKQYSDIKEYINFSYVPESRMIKRRNSQMEYFNIVNGIFTMGHWLRDSLIEESGINKEKVFQVGGGINLDVRKVNKNIRKTNNKILFVGRDFKRKGGELVVEAFKYLKSNYLKDSELFIAGPINLEFEYEGIHLLGDLNSEKLSYYFNICDIFCVPSFFEAYGLVFIEALAYGLPCIARDSFEMRNFIQDGETGYLISNNNFKELALKMYDLLNDDNIKKNVLEKNDFYINEYSWDTVARRITSYIFNIPICDVKEIN